MSAALGYRRARLCRRPGFAVPRRLPHFGVAGSQDWIVIVHNLKHLLRIPQDDYVRERTSITVVLTIGYSPY